MEVGVGDHVFFNDFYHYPILWNEAFMLHHYSSISLYDFSVMFRQKNKTLIAIWSLNDRFMD